MAVTPARQHPAAETLSRGLTASQVAERVARGETNASREPSSRTVGQILRANLLTRFNLILAVLLAVILAVGDLRDALFGIVPALNALVGIAQEVRAKRTLDRLVVVSAPAARVLRDGAVVEVAVSGIVLDDVVELRAGDQVVVDGVAVAVNGMEVDESLLTGESEPVRKTGGDSMLSGSFIVAGDGRMHVTAVGAQAYARRLAQEARQFGVVHSDLVAGVNRILRYVTWALVPTAALLLASQLRTDHDRTDAISGSVAALVGMVPQGLVLLTSIAFAVAAVTLARRHVLVQELPAVEGLARVDVVCFDKTGTLTDGSMTVAAVEHLDQRAPVEDVLGALAADPGANLTMRAVRQRFAEPEGWVRTAEVPFASSRRWSGASFAGQGTWVVGAPEVVAAGDDAVLSRSATLAATGRRVLLLGSVDALPVDGALRDARPAAIVLLEERVRDDAAETLAYFADQGVALKVISGDNPATLSAVAGRVGLPGSTRALDGDSLPTDDDALGRAVENASVFGRVSPRQKQAMVRALQARGHTVAMTGDGVNDVLALKRADIGVAMGGGAAATRAVAQVVLLDSRFSSLPGVVAEGRRVTANIERVANLFITKTVWATLLAVAVGIAQVPYPLLPRQLSVIDTLTIGVPAFFLALAPNRRRFVPGFVGRVLRFTVPTGAAVAAAALVMYRVATVHGLTLAERRTTVTVVIVALSLAVLVVLAQPLTWRRILLITAVAAAFASVFVADAVQTFYALPDPRAAIADMLVISLVGGAVLTGGWFISRARPH